MKPLKIVIVLALMLFAVTFMASCNEGAGNKETEKNEPAKEKIEETTEEETTAEETTCTETEDIEEMEGTTYVTLDSDNIAETVPYVTDKDNSYDTTVAAPVTSSPKETAKVPVTSLPKETAKAPETSATKEPVKPTSKTEEITAVKDTVQESEKVNSGAYTIEAPSEELLQRIEDDYYYGYLGKTEDGFKTRIKEYYGEYDGCVPVIFLLPYAAGDFAHDIVKKEEIGGVIFNYKWERIMVWKDGEFYTVREAYEGGHLTKESLVIIAELYNTQTYVDLLSRTNETVRRP